jgi:FKBP-type peptidyl-prolyl cis-trans isomerase FklB
MKVVVAVVCFLALAVSFSEAQKKTELKTQKQKASYGIGLDIGKNFKQEFPEVDVEAMVLGFRDALSGTKQAVDEKELTQVMTEFQKEMMAKRADRMAAVGEKNKKEGEAFLAENKKKEGVVTLPSGLQYKIIKAGTGPKPKKENTVKCNYRGTLLDGKEFDSSYKRGEPTEFSLVQVIPGWTEALLLMPTGSKWELYIPANLGWGERGTGADIGPNATVIFEIELLSFK